MPAKYPTLNNSSISSKNVFCGGKKFSSQLVQLSKCSSSKEPQDFSFSRRAVCRPGFITEYKDRCPQGQDLLGLSFSCIVDLLK